MRFVGGPLAVPQTRKDARLTRVKEKPEKQSVLPADALETLLHESPDAMLVSNTKGEIVFANRKASALFGYSPDEITERTIEDLVAESHAEQHRDLRRSFAKTPHSRPLLSGLEIRARRKCGEEIRVDVSLAPIGGEDEMLVASTIREVDSISGSEAYFRTLLETAPDAMVIVDGQGVISVVNSQTESMFGYSRSELLGKPIEVLLPERFRDRHIRNRMSYVNDPTLRPMGQGLELRGLRKNGKEFPVEISLSPVATATGQFISSTIRDVTERDRMEKQLISARQEAERANKANTAFLAAASHDLRQPVQALALLNGALRRTVKDARALEMIESQEHSLTAMTNLLNSLLDISRLDAGAIAPEFEEFPIGRVIDRLAAEFGRQAKHKGLAFAAESIDVVVRSDPSLLAEILQNLVSNAIRYTEQGSVSIRCERVDSHCRLDVVDTGVGIADDEMELIFQEFQQGANQSANKEGFGLGLAIVRRLAELLGVDITVRSEVGKGSCFTILIPALAATADLVEQDGGPGIQSGAEGRLLLVEDNLNVANAWSMLLEAEGYTVVQAVSRQEVESMLADGMEQPALIVSDYHLAEESTGVEVIQLVRAAFSTSIPAFIVSGDTSKVVTDARLVDNSMLFSKPVNTDDLLAAAKDVVASGTVPG